MRVSTKRSPQLRPERRSEAAVIAIGALSIAVLLPLVLGTFADTTASFIVAALLLGLAAWVRPEGNAAPLRWIPLAFGVFACLGGVVGLLG
jgi:hypothetical protein